MAKIYVSLVLLLFVTADSFANSAQDEEIADIVERMKNDVDYLKVQLKTSVDENIEKDDADTDADADTADDDDDAEDDDTINKINVRANVESVAEAAGEILQGEDIILTPEQVAAENYDNDPLIARDANWEVTKRWPKTGDRVRLPIRIDSSISFNKKKIIRTAIKKYAELTCIDIVEASGTEHYVKIINSRGCYSYLGMVLFREGFQPLSIGDGCGRLGTVEHEFMHTLGFFHEQSRPDRDSFIKVQLQNLRDRNYAGNFDKQQAVDSAGEPYDIKSIMQYDSTAFAKPNTYTIVRKDNGQPFTANRGGFSTIDLKQINKLLCDGLPELPTPAPAPTPAPTPSANNCEGFVKLGLCDYKVICRMCKAQCTSNVNKSFEIFRNLMVGKCEVWQKKGLCGSSKYGSYMRHYCMKSCFREKYPTDGECQ